MPATVKGLEQRIDESAVALDSLRAMVREEISELRQAIKEPRPFEEGVAAIFDQLMSRSSEIEDQVGTTRQQISNITSSQDIIRAQLATLTSVLSSTQAQFAVTVARLDNAIDESRATRTKLDTMSSDYAAFRSKAETTFAMVRWIGVFMAGVLVTVILSAFSVARSAGSLDATVQQQ